MTSITPFARRTNSSTSLAQFYQESNSNFHSGRHEGSDGPDLSFCNAFWGPNDAGYEVLMARLRATGRTMDDMKAFWKERANIEEEYAKRLSKLAKIPVGKDEMGELRAALEALRAETDKQAAARQKLATEIKRDIEGPTGEFVGRLTNLKKTYQGNIEKSYKNKTIQESHVAKARERYEQDCLRINSFTANSSIVQGKELDKLQRQLEKVNLSVGGNERDYRSYVKMLEETSRKWEGEWKGFCDHVQDLEEERVDFIKDNVWVYANAVSSVCVTDDESCERIRVSLEGFETSTEMETFVKNFGTGARIPDPPPFVDYSRGEGYSQEHGYKQAKFQRLSSRPPTGTSNTDGEVLEGAPSKYHDDEEAEELAPPPIAKAAPASAPVSNGQRPEPQRQQSMPRSHSPFGGVPLPGMAAAPAVQRSESPAPSAVQHSSSYTSAAPSVRPPSAFARPSSAFGNGPAPTGPAAMRSLASTEDDDPISRSLAELRRDPPPAGSIKRGNSSRRQESLQSVSRPGSVQGFQPPRSPVSMTAPSDVGSRSSASRQSFHHASRPSMDTTLIPPATGHTAADLARSREDYNMRNSRSVNSNQDFHAAASDVVGGSPRPHTPSGSTRGGPSPAFMQPPAQPPSPIVDGVMSQYHQAFPGERSRGPSRNGSISSRRSRGQSISIPTQPEQHNSIRAPSREGFVGIGAGTATLARSPSPQPGMTHAASGSFSGHPPSSIGFASSASQSSFAPLPIQTQSLNARGSGYGAAPAQQVNQPPQQGSSYPGVGKSTSMGGPTSPFGSPLGQNQYGSVGQNVYQVGHGQDAFPPQIAQAFVTQPSPAPSIGQSGYHQSQAFPQQYAASPASYNPPAQSLVSGYPGPHQGTDGSLQQNGHPGYEYRNHSPSPSPAPGGYQQPPQQQAYQPTLQHQHSAQHVQNPYARSISPAPPQQTQHQQQQLYQAPQQIVREPSPAPAPIQAMATPAVAPVDTPPTGQYSTSGEPILFYGERQLQALADTPSILEIFWISMLIQDSATVKALYDYRAESDSEFDFQTGDIIAVTHTPADGWWSGELLDEARRQPGRTDFPSNFVCLF